MDSPLVDRPEVFQAVAARLEPPGLSALLRASKQASAQAWLAWHSKLQSRRQALSLPRGEEGEGEALGAPRQLRRRLAGLEDHRAIDAICFGAGWAVHAVVMRFRDGSLRGGCLENDQSPVELEAEALARSGRLDMDGPAEIRWHRLTPNEYVIRVSGVYTESEYLCHHIVFELNTGRRIERSGCHNGWRSSQSFDFGVDGHEDGGRVLSIIWDSSYAFRSGVQGLSVNKPM